MIMIHLANPQSRLSVIKISERKSDLTHLKEKSIVENDLSFLSWLSNNFKYFPIDGTA